MADIRRPGGRAGVGARRISTSHIGCSQSGCTGHPPLARFISHHFWPDHHWAVRPPMEGGGVGVQCPRTRRDRGDFDLGPLDSVSGRISFSPSGRLTLQASSAHLHAAEAEYPPQPRGDVNRTTVSAIYHRMTASAMWATTLAYGVNAGSEVIPGDVVDLVTHAVLLESQISVRERHTWFGRIEVVGKPGHDLHVHEAPATVFGVGKVQAGYVRYFSARKGVALGIGGTASVSLVPPALATRYSGRAAPGFGVFVTVRPARHAMSVAIGP